jgi:hypothetical protein
MWKLTKMQTTKKDPLTGVGYLEEMEVITNGKQYMTIDDFLIFVNGELGRLHSENGNLRAANRRFELVNRK